MADDTSNAGPASATDGVGNPATKGLSLLPRGRIGPESVEAWLTLDDGSSLCAAATPDVLKLERPEIEIDDVLLMDPATRFQAMLGIGGTIMDSDVWNLMRLAPELRREAIQALVGADGLGLNLMRIPFGSTDWNRDWDFYTYCDVPRGEKDLQLRNFSIRKDVERDAVQVIKEMLSVNPDIKILASVWGIPAWMKTNDSIMHGFFDSQFTGVYTKYLAKSIIAYRELGVQIQYITVQNEPGTSDDRDTPAAMMTWRQQREVVKELRRELDRVGLDTSIWIMDHNFDMTQVYAKPLLDDPATKAAVGGVAYHDYRGRIDEMSLLHHQHPDVPAVMTERNRGGLKDMLRMIRCFRNWATGHISWTTVVDERGGPHQYGGGSSKRTPCADPHKCGHIMLVTSGEPAQWVSPVVHYYYAQMTQFVRRGAVRIATSSLAHLETENVAFENPDGTRVLVIANAGTAGHDIVVQLGGDALPVRLPAQSMLTLLFRK